MPALLVLALACGGESSSPPQQKPPPTTPPPPSNLPAGLHATRSLGTVVLSWQPAAGATSYQVNAFAEANGVRSSQALGTTPSTTVEVLYTAAGELLPLVTFQVQALGNGITNPPATVDVPAPPLPVLAVVAHHRVNLTWPFDAVAGHAAIVQRSSETTPQSDIGRSSTESFEDLNFTDGITHTYSVRISTAQLDLFSRSVTAFFPTGAPQDVVAAPDNDGVRLSWTRAEGEFTARVSRSDTPGGPYTVVADGVGPLFVAGCPFATTCYFVVTSVAHNGTAGATSVEVNARRRPFPPASTAHSLVGAVEIDFPDRPPDAQSFIISRLSSSSGGIYEEIGRTSDLSFVDTTAVPFEQYRYQVQSTNGQSVSDGAETNAARSTEPPDQQSISPAITELSTTVQDVGQSFTAGKSGQLMAIEVLGDFQQFQSMSLHLFQGETELANVPPWNHSFLNWIGPLDSREVLGLYYDLSSFGISMSAGQTLRFEMSVPAHLDLANVSLAGAPYPGGTVFLDGAPDPSRDLVFKTFIRPGTQLTTPAPLEASGGTQGVSLRWPASQGAAGYRIGRSDSPGGAKTALGTTAQTTFVDTGLTPSATYYYQVVAVAADGSETSSPEQGAQVLPMVVDQTNLADQPDGTAFVVFADPTGVDRFASQVVTVGKPGLLAGFEVSALGFPTLRLRILDDASGTQLGSVDYQRSIFGGIHPHALLPTLVGPGYLDLTSLGLQVAAGERLRFEVTTPPLDLIPHTFQVRKDGSGGLAFKTFVQ